MRLPCCPLPAFLEEDTEMVCPVCLLTVPVNCKSVSLESSAAFYPPN